MAVVLEKVYTNEALTLYRHASTVFITQSPGFGASLPLKDSWQSLGTYAFVPAAFDDYADFARKLNSPMLRGMGLFWVVNPEDDVINWQVGGLYPDKTAGARIAAKTSRLGLSPYSLFIHKGAVIDCDGEKFSIFPQNGLPLALQVSKTVFDAEGATFATDGTLHFTARGNSPDFLTDLNVQIRFTTAMDEDGFDAALSGFVHDLSSPFSTTSANIALDCVIDLLHLYEPDRSYITLPANIPISGGFSTLTGREVKLFSTNHSRLAFARLPLYLHSKQQATLHTYLCPHGQYALEGADSEDIKLLCGLFGTEFFRIRGGDVIEFAAGRDAFITGDALGGLSTTAWLKMPANTPYISQPADAPFYGNLSEGVMSFLEIPAATTKAATHPFPMMPYLHADGTLPASTLDGVIAKIRQGQVLDENSDGLRLNDVVVGVTTHGMMAGISTDGTDVGEWTWLALASTQEHGATPPNMRFINIAPQMRYDFQGSCMRKIYRNPQDILNFAQISEDFNFDPDGWTFHASPHEWHGDTAMIIQYSMGVTLAEWLGDEPIFSAALRRAHKDDGTPKENYKEFVHIANDPMFQGIVLLNCPVSVDREHGGFIPALGPILDSIDTTRLAAHHLIIYRSQICTEGGKITLAGSSVSALLDYQQNSADFYSRDGARPDFGFCTTQFLLMVNKSRVSRIESNSELMINRLFGANSTGMGNSGNSLIISGWLQTDGGTTSYIYSLAEGGEFALGGSAAEVVAIDTVELMAQGHDATFRLGGRLCFAVADGVDLFGYGKDEEGGEVGLRFSGMNINMHTESQATNMDIDYNGIILRPAESIPRADGLPSLYPAIPRRFVHSLTAPTPNDDGYTSIETPIRQDEMAAPWFGIEYEIPLGGLGALAGPEGITLKLLAAWSVGDATPNHYFGIKLPSIMRLQGVFQLGFASISLEAQTNGDQTTFMLTMNQFAVKLLGLTFPPGENKLMLIADPKTRQLGWYAAYKEDENEFGS